MAWVTNPTFANGAVLSASDLNKLSSNSAFLYGRIQGVNVPFSSLRSENISLTASNNGWAIRHEHRYLHYRLTLVSGDIDGGDDLTVRYDGNSTVVESSPTELGTPQTWTGYIDTDSYGLTVGDWYTIYVTTDNNGTSVFSVDYLLESDATSI